MTTNARARLNDTLWRRRWVANSVVVAFLALHLGLLADLARHDSPTLDELAHLPAGISHLTSGDFSLYRVNPPLAQSVAALHMLAMRPASDWLGFSQDRVTRQESVIGQRFWKY